MTVDTVCSCLGVSCNHGKERFLSICCAEQDALQGMCHDEVLKKGGKQEKEGERKGREEACQMHTALVLVHYSPGHLLLSPSHPPYSQVTSLE